MTRRMLAPTVVALFLVCVGTGIVLQVVGRGAGNDLFEGLSFIAAFGLFAVLGAVLLARRPGHMMGPLFAVVGLLPAIGFAGDAYAAARVIAGQPVPLWARVLVWPTAWYWYVVLAILAVYVPLLFPDGRLPSPRWRWIVWLVSAGLAVACALSAVSERIELQTLGPGGQGLSVVNPFGIAGMPHGEDNPLFDRLGAVMAIGVVAALAAVVVRFRRSRGAERQQVKWFVSAVCLTGIGIAVDVVALRLPRVVELALDATFLIGVVAVPVSITLAILRYRLYAIDRIISRTATYAVVTAVLVGVYALVAVVPSVALDVESDLLVAAATLAAAGAFVPVRRRVQSTVDRRFNRARYDATRVVERFGTRLRDDIDLQHLAGDLQAVVAATVQPTHMSLWLPEARP